MKSFIILLLLVWHVDFLAAEPLGRLGHAFPKSVHTRSSLGKRRLGYAARPLSPSKPIKRDLNSRLPGRTINLPLTRNDNFQGRSNIHPMMYYQQQMNHAHRRLARYLGHTIPDEELVDRLKKRAESLNLDFSMFRLLKRGVPLDALEARREKGRQKTSQAEGNGVGFSQDALDALLNDKVTKAQAPTAKNTLGLDIEANDSGYFAKVLMGSAGTPFGMLVDSGSADTWVPGEDCQNSDTGANTCNHQTLGPKSSSTFAESNKQFRVTYGSGNVQGNLIQDNMDIGGLILNGTTFGATSTESDDFGNKNVAFDGLMGLASSKLSQQGVPTPIENLAKAGTVQAAQIGYTLGRVSDGVNQGQITFGGVDNTRFDGDLTLISNINQDGFWEAALDGVSVDGNPIKIGGQSAILDTGTTLIIAPIADAEAVHAAINGSKSDGKGGFTIPCTTNAKVALTFGGKSFSINPADMLVEPLTIKNLRGDCASGISGGSIGGNNQWLVGDVFLKNVYFATDIDNNQIGLAAIISPNNGGNTGDTGGNVGGNNGGKKGGKGGDGGRGASKGRADGGANANTGGQDANTGAGANDSTVNVGDAKR